MIVRRALRSQRRGYGVSKSWLALGMSEEQVLAALCEHIQEFMQQPGGAVVHARHAFQIEHDKVHPLDVFDDVAHHDLGGIEGKLSLQLIDLDLPTMLLKQLAGTRRPYPIRGDL